MTDNVKQVVSMLVAEEKITLFTVTGQILEMKTGGTHNTTKIIEFLTDRLDGKSIVDLNLNDYLNISKAIIPDGYESEGIIITRMVDGKEVQGIFYPSKIQVAVQHEGEEVIIPDVEKLENHAQRAAEDNSPSVRNFLRRLAPVVKDRKHSAEDLMNFIQRSDLPLTNDGRIIGYKRVKKGPKPGTFVDCHTGSVVQQVGSHVWMDVDAVDPDRNRDCSHGLHVANLGYLGGFSGDHTLIVLVEPENFIAVPHRDTNKCRVCAYDIIGVMTAGSQKMVNSGAYVANDQTFKDVLAEAIEGRHIKPFEAVKVGQRGQILETVPIKGAEIPMQGLEAPKAETKTTTKSLKEDEKKVVEKKDIVKMAKKTTTDNMWDSAPANVMKAFGYLKAGKSKTDAAALADTSTRTLTRWMDKYGFEAWMQAAEAQMTIAERARQMFNQGAYDALMAFKRARRKGWYALGFSDREVRKIEEAIT